MLTIKAAIFLLISLYIINKIKTIIIFIVLFIMVMIFFNIKKTQLWNIYAFLSRFNQKR